MLKERLIKLLHGNKPVYIVHHIPKSGGTSLRVAMKNWFQLKQDYRDLRQLKENHDKIKYNINLFKPSQCLYGHFDVDGIYLDQRYPEVFKHSKFRVITFVRDPLDLIISLYYYEKKVGRGSELPLNDYIFLRENYIANRFPCNENNYKDTLNRYFFIGITERLEESISLLASKINKPKISLGRLNTTQKDNQIMNISKEEKERFKIKNQLDYKLYNYCVKKFEETITNNRK